MIELHRIFLMRAAHAREYGVSVFTPTNKTLQRVALELRDKLYGDNVDVNPSKHLDGGVDFTPHGKPNEALFTLCVGATSTIYLDKHTLRGDQKWIYRSKPNADINSKDDLTQTLRGFIHSTIKPGEIIDASLEALENKRKTG